jgi:ATP-dependent RNA helicase DDX19/DBP5
MIGQSQSGTGKTAAFVLTMLSRIDFTKNKTQVRVYSHCYVTRRLATSQALCLAPSRELARQIMSVIVSMGKYTNVQTEFAIKEHLPRDVSRITAHIVVGTPGTMTDLLRRRVIDPSEVKVFVCDEADNMLDQDGLGDQTLRVKKCVL